MKAWAVEWRSANRLDGRRRHLVWSPESGPGDYRLFRTRAACRAYIEARYGYIRKRPDLRSEPIGWRIPQAVRVKVEETPWTIIDREAHGVHVDEQRFEAGCPLCVADQPGPLAEALQGLDQQDIAAVEAEAVIAVLATLRAEVEGLPHWPPPLGVDPPHDVVERAAVLALIYVKLWEAIDA